MDDPTTEKDNYEAERRHIYLTKIMKKQAMRTDEIIQKPVNKTLLQLLTRSVEEKVKTNRSESRIFSAVNIFNLERWRRSALARRAFSLTNNF